MLAVTQTALPGIGLSIPQVGDRHAQPYLAIRANGPMQQLPQFAPGNFERLHNFMRKNGVEAGEGFFRYRAFREDGSVELDVGTTTGRAVGGGGEVFADTLPAGRYASATYTGPYDRLYDAFCMLNGWVTARGLAVAGEDDAPECQVEIYRISPAQEADPVRWETDLLLKIKE